MLPVRGAVQPWACQEAGQDSAPRCPTARHTHGHASPSLAMAEIEEADNDDWATTTVPDSHLYATSLSPPLFQRSASSDKMVRNPCNSSTLTFTAARPSSMQSESGKGQSPGPARGPVLPKLDTNRQIRWSNSPASSLLTSPESPQLVEDMSPLPFMTPTTKTRLCRAMTERAFLTCRLCTCIPRRSRSRDTVYPGNMTRRRQWLTRARQKAAIMLHICWPGATLASVLAGPTYWTRRPSIPVWTILSPRWAG